MPNGSTDRGTSPTDSRVARTDGGVVRTDGGSSRGLRGARVGNVFDPEELRRRNLSAVAIDVLYLFTTAFLATVAVRGLWPAVIVALPLATLLYFSWQSTTAFFVAQILVIALSVAATLLGVVPL